MFDSLTQHQSSGSGPKAGRSLWERDIRWVRSPPPRPPRERSSIGRALGCQSRGCGIIARRSLQSCGCSSLGRARPSQGRGSGFEARQPLHSTLDQHVLRGPPRLTMCWSKWNLGGDRGSGCPFAPSVDPHRLHSSTVEHSAFTRGVAGSSPAGGTTLMRGAGQYQLRSHKPEKARPNSCPRYQSTAG